MRKGLPKYLFILIFLVGIIISVLAFQRYTLFSKVKATVQGTVAWIKEYVDLNFFGCDVMSNGTTIIAGSATNGCLYKSMDEGLTWQLIWTHTMIESNKGFIHCVFVDSRDYVYVGGIAVDDDQNIIEGLGLYRSTDYGQTFEKVWENGRDHIWQNGICEDDQANLYLAPHDSGSCNIWKSTDQGATFNMIFTHSVGKHFHAICFNNASKWLYAVSGDLKEQEPSNWRSRDYGATWEQLYYAAPNENPYLFVGLGCKQNDVYCGTHGGPGLGLAWSRVMRFYDDGTELPPIEEVLGNGVFYTGYGPTEYDMLIDWVRTTPDEKYMLVGGTARGNDQIVGIYVSQSGNVGNWTRYFEIPRSEACFLPDSFPTWFRDWRGYPQASHKWTKNGWIFIANTIEGRGIRVKCQVEAHARLVVRGLNNRIWYRIYNSSGGSWEGWNVVPCGLTCDSPAAAMYSGKLYIVVRGMDGQSLWFGWINLTDNSFSEWTRLTGATPSAPTLVHNDSRLILAVRGLNNRIYYRFYDCISDEWEGWTALPSGTTCDSPAATMLGGNLHLVVRGFSTTSVHSNYTLWHGVVDLSTGILSGWTRLPGATKSAPTLAAWQTLNRLYLVVRGFNNRIYYNIWNGTDWEGWTALPSGTTCDSSAAIIIGNKLHIVVRGVTGTSLWHYYIDLATDDHSGWTRISGQTPSAPTLTS